MNLELANYYSIGSAAFYYLGYLTYLFLTIRGGSRPSLVTWSIILLINLPINLNTPFLNYSTSVLFLTHSLNVVVIMIIFIFAVIKSNVFKSNKKILFIIGYSLSIALLYFINIPLFAAESINRLILLIALVPTVVKTYRDTSSEYYTPWIFWVLSYICSLLVVMILEMDISLQQYLIAALLFLNALVILIKKFKIRS